MDVEISNTGAVLWVYKQHIMEVAFLLLINDSSGRTVQIAICHLVG